MSNVIECHVCEKALEPGDEVIVVGRNNDAYFCSKECFDKDVRENAEDYAFNLVYNAPLKVRTTTLKE